LTACQSANDALDIFLHEQDAGNGSSASEGFTEVLHQFLPEVFLLKYTFTYSESPTLDISAYAYNGHVSAAVYLYTSYDIR
jgi:hypothetical protein